MADVLPDKEDIEVLPFDEGFSNAVYLVRKQNVPQLVIRLPSLDTDVFCIDRESEIKNLKLASSMGLSPDIVWSDLEGRIVCEFVSQPTLDWGVRHNTRNVIRIAEVLTKVHQFPKGDCSYSIVDVVSHYLDRIAFYAVNDQVIYKEWRYLSAQLNGLPTPTCLLPLVVCHNDLNPKNILIDDSKLWLIDWEYSGVGDPLFDLAVVVKSHNLDAEQTILLLNSYKANLASEEALSNVRLYTRYYSLREMAWLLLKYCVSRREEQSLVSYYEFKTAPTLNPFPID